MTDRHFVRNATFAAPFFSAMLVFTIQKRSQDSTHISKMESFETIVDEIYQNDQRSQF